MTVNERLRMVRESKGMTQGEFGREIEVAQNYLSQIENGSRPVTAKILRIVCLNFGVSEDWLRTGEGEMYEKKPAADDLLGRLAVEYKMSDAEISFLEAYLQLPPDKRKVLEELIDRACDIRARRIGETQRAFADSLLAEALPNDLSQAGNE